MALQPKLWGTHSCESRAFLSPSLHATSLCLHTYFLDLRFVVASGSKEMTVHETKIFFLTLLKEAFMEVHKIDFPLPLHPENRISFSVNFTLK